MVAHKINEALQISSQKYHHCNTTELPILHSPHVSRDVNSRSRRPAGRPMTIVSFRHHNDVTEKVPGRRGLSGAERSSKVSVISLSWKKICMWFAITLCLKFKALPCLDLGIEEF